MSHLPYLSTLSVTPPSSTALPSSQITPPASRSTGTNRVSVSLSSHSPSVNISQITHESTTSTSLPDRNSHPHPSRCSALHEPSTGQSLFPSLSLELHLARFSSYPPKAQSYASSYGFSIIAFLFTLGPSVNCIHFAFFYIFTVTIFNAQFSLFVSTKLPSLMVLVPHPHFFNLTIALSFFLVVLSAL